MLKTVSYNKRANKSHIISQHFQPNIIIVIIMDKSWGEPLEIMCSML